MGAKAEALKALTHVKEMLAKPELDPLGQRQLLATVEFAEEQVTAIEERKRRRSIKKETTHG